MKKISNEKMFLENYFPTDLIPISSILSNSLIHYSPEQIALFAQNVGIILRDSYEKLTPELLTWALHILPCNFLIESRDCAQIACDIYEKLLEGIPFKPEIKERNGYVMIFLLHLSLLFTQTKYPNQINKLAESISKNVIIKSNFSVKTKLIAIHLLFIACNTLKNTEFFTKRVDEALNSLMNLQSEVKYEQFDSQIDQFFGDQIFASFRNFISYVLQAYISCKGQYDQLYKYFIGKINDCESQIFKHKIFVEFANIITEQYIKSKNENSVISQYSIDNFKESYYQWFNKDMIFLHNPKYLFDFVYYGIDEKVPELTLVLQDAIITQFQQAAQESQLAVCELFNFICPFIFKYPDFIKSEKFATEVINAISYIFSLPNIPDLTIMSVITIISALLDLTGATYQKKIHSFILEIADRYSSKIVSNDNTIWALILHLLMQGNCPEEFWLFLSKLELKILPAVGYGSVSPLTHGPEFAKDPKLVYKITASSMAGENDQFSKMRMFVLHVIALSVTTNYFEQNPDEYTKFRRLLEQQPYCNWPGVRLLADVFKQSVLFGGFVNSSDILSDKSIDFATPSSIISVNDKNTLVLRNIVGSIKTVVTMIENNEEEEDALPMPEKDDEIELHIPTFQDGNQPQAYKNYKSSCDFPAFKEFDSQNVSAAMKLLRSSHLFNQSQTIKYVGKSNDDIALLDTIEAIPTVKVVVRRMKADSNEITDEASQDFTDFINNLQDVTLKPLCDIHYITDSTKFEIPHLLIIFNDGHYLPNLSKISEHRQLILQVRKSGDYYITDVLRASKDTKVFIPLNEQMKLLLNKENTAIMINLIIFAFYTSIPDTFVSNFNERSSKLLDIYKSIQDNNIAIFHTFYDMNTK